jgi:hypothetical protein
MMKLSQWIIFVVIETALALAVGNGHAAEMVIPMQPTMSIGRNTAFNLSDATQLDVLGTRALTGSNQSLLLDCDKIDRAQRSLNDAGRSGARQMPVFPGLGSASIDRLSLEERFHISRNQARFNALSQRFHCAAR